MENYHSSVGSFFVVLPYFIAHFWSFCRFLALILSDMPSAIECVASKGFYFLSYTRYLFIGLVVLHALTKSLLPQAF